MALTDSIRWLWPYLRRRRGAILAVMLLAAATSALATAQPYLTKVVIDQGLIGRHFNVLLEACLAIVAIAAAGFGLGAVNRWLYLRLSGGVLFELREDIYAHLLELSPRFFRTRSVGDLVNRLDGDVGEIQRFSVDSLLAFVNAVLLLVFALVVMVAMSPLLSVIAVGMVPVHFLVRHASRRYVADSTREVRESRGVVTQFLVETLGAVKWVQSAVAQRWERQRLNTLNRGLLRRLVRQQLVGYAVGTLSSLLSHLTTALVFIVGGWQVIHGRLTVGTLVAFTAYMMRGTGSATSLLGLYTAYQRANVSLVRVRELLAEQPPVRTEAGQGRRLAPGVPAHLRLQDVQFRHPDGVSAVLAGVSVEIAAGSKVVLCGESGAGKSTVVDLLRGFLAPDGGEIEIDGRPLGEYELDSVRRRIAVLESDPMLFRGTVLENLRYGNFEATLEQVQAAARQTGLEAIVARLPQGLDTELGARGAGLSTGERQRLAVARVLLGAPAVLVLDEATSNLDAVAVRSMHELIDRHLRACTRIVITHSPGLVPNAERILELREGRVRERRSTAAYG
jgi:ATP-binding cassette subfamily B protein